MEEEKKRRCDRRFFATQPCKCRQRYPKVHVPLCTRKLKSYTLNSAHTLMQTPDQLTLSPQLWWSCRGVGCSLASRFASSRNALDCDVTQVLAVDGAMRIRLAGATALEVRSSFEVRLLARSRMGKSLPIVAIRADGVARWARHERCLACLALVGSEWLRARVREGAVRPSAGCCRMFTTRGCKGGVLSSYGARS